MPARKKTSPGPARSKPAARRPRPAQATAAEPGGASSVSDIQAAGGAGGTVASDNDNRSEQTQVVLPAADEPVRCGGYVLTRDGWVLEDGAGDDDQAVDHSAEKEKE